MSRPIVARDMVSTFDVFRLDRRGLSRARGNGGWESVTLGSRALDVLRVLVDQGGELVTKQELMDAVWPGTAIEDSNLTVQISALRRALDRDRSAESCILTVVGRGYRFLPTVKWRADGELPAPCDSGHRRARSRDPVAPLRRRVAVQESW